MKFRYYLVFFLLSTSVYASTGNRNPASIAYVNTAIGAAAYTAGTNAGIVVDNTTHTISQTPNYKIGDEVQGGVVFWLDATNQHGLTVTKTDITDGRKMCGNNCPFAYTTSSGIGAGLMNTSIIVSTEEAANFQATNLGNWAPLITVEYNVEDTVGSWGGWYLPSSGELLALHSVIGTVNQALSQIAGADKLTSNNYWSSTAGTTLQYVTVNPITGEQIPTDQGNSNFFRGVRQF